MSRHKDEERDVGLGRLTSAQLRTPSTSAGGPSGRSDGDAVWVVGESDTSLREVGLPVCGWGRARPVYLSQCPYRWGDAAAVCARRAGGGGTAPVATHGGARGVAGADLCDQRRVVDPAGAGLSAAGDIRCPRGDGRGPGEYVGIRAGRRP